MNSPRVHCGQDEDDEEQRGRRGGGHARAGPLDAGLRKTSSWKGIIFINIK